MQETIRTRQKRGPRGKIAILVRQLIKKQELTDKEICETIKTKYPEASTSIKCVQFYRCQMRAEGEIPPAKINRRKEKTILMWELIPGDNAAYIQGIPGSEEKIEGQYNGKQLINKCRKFYMVITGATKREAYKHLYSVPTCALFLKKLGWECVEFAKTIKYSRKENEA